MAKKISARYSSFLTLSLVCAGLSACSSDVKNEANYPDKARAETYKQGSLLSDKGGVDLLGGERAKDSASGMTVNAFLWRAALDTVSFMPLASADPFGGVILTDWYAKPGLNNERMKLNVFIVDRDLRADGVKVRAFKQVRKNNAEWTDVEVPSSVTTTLEETILTRARQMKVAQKTAAGK